MESDDQEYVEAGTGVMVSNLPLLFARGRPTSLHHMSLAELEIFVPFMVRCSVGEERPVPWSQLPRPSWWPRKLPFRMPSASSAAATRTALLDLVERCYTYHGCEYLLQFCDSLTVQMPSSGYRFNDNRDGTTSMYHGCTGKLLVTFRNENRDYDKYCHEGRSTQKKLLLSPSAHTERRGSNGTAMFQPPVSDIYLCDKCENEFYSLREVQIHEKQCRGDANSSSHVPSPEPEPIDDEPEPAGQVPFLAYFSLQPAEHTGIKPYMSPRKRSVPSPPRKLFGPTYPRYDSIALSSPLGKFLLANSKFRNKVQATQHLVMKYERNLRASPNMEIASGRERCLNRWIVVWRPGKEAQPWIHKYCFNRLQREEQKLTIATGLNRKSRHLLRRCRPCNVKVKRLQKRLVDRYKRLGGPSAPCIDLTDESQTLPMHQLPFPMLVNNFDRSPDEHFTLLHSPQSKVNLGASSSYVSTSSNSWASTSHHLTGLPFFQDGSRRFGIQADNLLHALSTPGYYVFDEKGSHNAKPVSDEGRWKKQEYPASGISAAKPGSRSHHHRKNSDRLNSSLPLNISESTNSPVIKNEGLFNTRREHSSNSHSDLEAGKDCKANTEAKMGVVPSRFYSNNSLVVSHSGEMTNSWPFQSVPHVFESVNDSLLVDSANVSVSRTNSSIEIIDLSSDDDETVKSRSQNEADNAPQQLDGFHCYPHSGAKIPFSSKNSLPKNGNSHWSSVQKSHCGAGHLGDLATNGQPPNVPPNLPVSPVPDRVFSPIANTPVTPSTSGNKKNSHRRKHRRSVVDRKIMNLDDSQKDTNLSNEYEMLNKDGSDCDEQNPKQRSGTLTGTSLVDGETFPDALTGDCLSFSEDSVCQDPHGLVIDNEISFKPPLHVDDEISFNISQRHLHSDGSGKHKESASGFEDPSQEKRLQSVGAPVVGFISNIVNTVNRGVEFFKALVGGNSGDNFLNDKDTQLKASAKEEVEQMSNRYKSSLLEEDFNKKSRKRKSREMDKLLQDECLELRQRGLGELRHLDIQEARLTRRSVERYIPRKARRKEVRRQKNLGRRHLNVHSDAAEKITHKRDDSEFSLSKREKIDFLKRRKYLGVEASNDPEMDSKYSEVQCASEASKITAASITTPSFLPSLNELNMLEDCIDENGNSPTYSDISSVFDGDRSKVVDCNYNNEVSESKPLMAGNKAEGIDQEVHRSFKAECINTEKVWNDGENKEANVLKSSSKETSSNRSKGTRELLNLANVEWKEMVNKGFHPLNIVKPALMKKEREQKENMRRSQKASMLKEFHSAVQGGGGDFRADSRPTEIYSQENLHCAYSSHLGKKEAKVECPLAKSNITSSCMGETAEEHGALLAEIPGAEAHSEPISNSISECSLTYKASVSFCKDKYSDLVSNPLSTDSSITEDKSSINSRLRSKKLRRKKSKFLPRELYNLVGDEWKEMRGKGFHPSDLLGTYDGKVEYMDNGAEGECIQESKPCQKSDSAADESSKKTKLSRELVRLLKDECKELQPLDIRRKRAKSNSKKSLQPFGLKRLQEAYNSADLSTRQRSNFQNLALASACNPQNGSFRMAENICRLSGTKFQLTRNTRSQTNVLSNVEVFTPRSSHREILQTELAMCVLNYNLPTII